MQRIELERYLAAFETWARVADQDVAIAQSIAHVAVHLRVTYQGEEMTSIDMRFEHACVGGNGAARGQIRWAK